MTELGKIPKNFYKYTENNFKTTIKSWGRASPNGSACKESACNAGDEGDMGLVPGSGRPPGRGHGKPLQYS